MNELQEVIEGVVDTEPRPAVVRFAQLMERKLRGRDYKGGWKNCTLQCLVGGMMEEVFELTGAMDAILTDDGPTNLYAVIEEAVDVANYCMMLWMLRGLLRGLSRMRSWSVPWENSRRRASKEERKCQFDTV